MGPSKPVEIRSWANQRPGSSVPAVRRLMPQRPYLIPLLAPMAAGAMCVATVLVLAAVLPVRAASPALEKDEVFAFTDRHCSGCHNDVDREGGLDLTTIGYDPSRPDNAETWTKVHDKLAAGEMPPSGERRPAPAEMRRFVAGLESSLESRERERLAPQGRALQRRLNRSEYENALRDLLQLPWIQVRDQLPEDGEAFRFNKLGDALDVSFVHMARYMGAASQAMREAIAVQLVRPPTAVRRYYAREDTSMTRRFFPAVFNGVPDRLKFPVFGLTPQPLVRQKRAPFSVGDSDPQTRELEAVGWTHSNYVTGFASNWNSFVAPISGRYRVRFSGYTLWVGGGGHHQIFANGRDETGRPGPRHWFKPDYDTVFPGRRNEPIIVYAEGGTMNRRIGEFDLTPEPAVQEAGDVWLVTNENLVTDSARFYRSRPTGFQGGFTNPLAQRDGIPGVAFRWMEVEGPLYDESTGAGYRLLFGNLPLKRVEPGEPGVFVEIAAEREPPDRNGRQRARTREVKVEVIPEDAPRDAERLLRHFMAKAYRRPVEEADVQRFLALFRQQFEAGLGFADALLAGYTAVLASPEFVFIREEPGRLDDFALATRLALFLWNSVPDAALRQRAERGELQQSGVLAAEASRLLADPRAERFVSAFLDYWLDLRKMEDTTPSHTLYNDYYLDESLAEAAVAETRLTFTELLRRNLPSRHVVDSDFTFLNGRLAAHYAIPGVEGVAMRKVALPKDSVRGGFLTQASVLKVTANGTTSSPVVRGRWITERIMGYELPPPPASVPAVEPDIRGAVTIRQQLDKHRADESCAVCHRKIDPAGFALESFDVLGGWRERYRANVVDGTAEIGFGRNGWPYAFSLALPVDSSGQLPDGRRFRDVRDFKRLLLEDERQIARNLARQLSIFATGARVHFSDRDAIEQILTAAQPGGYGVRSIIDALIQSDLFRHK